MQLFEIQAGLSGWPTVGRTRRKLVEITRTGFAPIAEKGVKRIGQPSEVNLDNLWRFSSKI
ncbi:hypothetical protein JOH51_002660 [Rhizobium leguminosarum]|nr:hypothetical protein [Rhizobium leguminosarum]